MKLKKQQKSRSLRTRGYSIKQISDLLKVSKGSVSNWVRDVELSEEALRNINNRELFGRENARKSRLINIFKARELLNEKCKNEILPFSMRDLWISGLILYAGEGRKVWNVSSQPIELTSSEPNILRIFINFLIKICAIPVKKIKIRLFLYPDIDIRKANDFWSNELDIPLQQFQKPFIKRSYNNPLRTRKSKYGTAHVIVCNAILYRKILGWLRAIYDYSNIK